LLDKAIEEYREAIRIQKDYAVAHSDLGCVLMDKGLLNDAINECEEAIRLKEDFPEAHCNLGLALMQKAQFLRSIEELRRGDKLGRRNPAHWHYPSEQWLRTAQRLAQLDDRLVAVLEGKDQPKDAGEWLGFALLCQMYRKYQAAAAEFYEHAFAGDPALADNPQAPHRYNAACAAALAGCGQGKDADKLNAKERARLRRQAMDWLRADLAAWGRLLEKEPEKITPVLAKTMQHWQQDTDLAGVRDAQALADLPEAERQSWQKLWSDVANLLKQAKERPPSEGGHEIARPRPCLGATK